VGLVLVIALLIIPPVAARFWSEQTHNVIAIGGGVGGIAGYLGAALSASHDSLPTGPIIVLVSFAVFVVSFLFAPSRGIAMAAYRQASMQKRLRFRSALLAAHRRATPQQPTDLPPPDLTPDLAPHDQRLLIKAKLITPTGQLTEL
ncbi:MAG: metal ABC transporter permease, partial [Pseudomonadota bacterium]